MRDRIALRDKRQDGWFRIDNEVYDLGLSCEAMAMYCALARYANNNTESAFFSGKSFKERHKIGHQKYKAARQELIDNNLIRLTGEQTECGAPFYELLNVKGCSATEQGGVSPQNRGCSATEQGGVSPRNTNNTNITILNNKTEKTHTPRADNPITTAAPPDQYDFTPLAEPFLEYSKHVRPVNLATFDYSVRVALTKTSIQDLGDAIRQVAEKRKANPDDPERYYIRMSNLLNSPEKILEYAAEFRKSNAGGWAEDSEHNAKKVARMLKHSVPIPDEAKRHIPRAEKLLEARAV